MLQYKCDISINGMRTEVTVQANNQTDARKIVEAQYPNSKITW